MRKQFTNSSESRHTQKKMNAFLLNESYLDLLLLEVYAEVGPWPDHFFENLDRNTKILIYLFPKNLNIFYCLTKMMY